ncbi:SDR family NAD(P)-dependent oxidoreductase [Streptomyces sp. cg40]|uniref:SDR family NAD(P)-dependent oxidoreductase n=1 Tax=Streptomyces sp. cg40 TaxID=3419764 RepID=UPI003D04109F
MSLQGQTAIITGAGSGIGRGTALRAAREGMHVVAVDVRNAEETVKEIVVAGGAATPVSLDVREPEGWRLLVEQTLEAHGSIAFLANVAGVVSLGADTAVEQTDEGWDRVIAINQTGTFYGMRAVMPAMIQSGGGAIVNVASVAGLVGMPNVFSYSASKGAVIAMSRQAATEFAKSGVRVNVICPGIIETPILGDITEELRTHCEAATPMGRLGAPDDIAAMAVQLARPESAFITGQVFPIDGGWTAQ